MIKKASPRFNLINQGSSGTPKFAAHNTAFEIFISPIKVAAHTTINDTKLVKLLFRNLRDNKDRSFMIITKKIEIMGNRIPFRTWANMIAGIGSIPEIPKPNPTISTEPHTRRYFFDL